MIHHRDTEDTEKHREFYYVGGSPAYIKYFPSVKLCALWVSVVRFFFKK